MENPSEIVRYVSRIWRIYKRQESLCHAAMRQEIPCRFRCQLGHVLMLSMLFRGEIGSIYDQVKCNLNDGDLGSIVRSNDNDLSSGQHPCNTYISEIVAGQQQLIEVYHNLVCELGDSHEAVEICKGHVEKLSEYTRNIAVQSERLAQNERAVYVSVA